MRMGAVLGIESSCDETAAAVLDADGRVLAEAVLSQLEQHAPFGGVVPEVAARAHLVHLPAMVADVLARAGVAAADLAGVGASSGPGLIGGLIVGAGFAKGMALAQGLPFVAVNHLEAHALTARLPGLVQGSEQISVQSTGQNGVQSTAQDGAQGGAAFPYLLLLLSGGHCQCIAVEGVGRYRRLGGTIDDAVGEAFDKVGKLLGLPWPGGPALERLAKRGNAARERFPRPLMGRAGCDFSFSGLKTAVAQRIATFPAGALPEAAAADIAAGFQAAVAEVLADRARNAIGMMPEARLLVVAGGVAANGAVRSALAALAERAGLTLVAPPIRLCTDNAVMVAWATLERLRLGLSDPLDTAPRPRWPLAELTGTANPAGPAEQRGDAA